MPKVYSIFKSFFCHPLIKDIENNFGDIYFAEDRNDFYNHMRQFGQELEVVILGVNETVTSALLDLLPTVKIIATVSSGTDHIDQDALRNRGIIFHSATGSNVSSVGEHALAMILDTLKNTRSAHEAAIHNLGKQGMSYTPQDLAGKTVGLVGAGPSARVLRDYLPHNKVNFWTRNRSKHQDFEATPATYLELQNLFSQSDIVSLHLALTPNTTGIITGALVQSLPQGAILINIARKQLLAPDVLDVLVNERPDVKIGFDVYDDDYVRLLRNSPRAYFPPHIAGVTEEALKKLQTTILTKILHDVTIMAQFSSHSLRNLVRAGFDTSGPIGPIL